MTKKISRIPNDVQDRDSIAWKKLCEYVEQIAENGSDEFVPIEAIGGDLFSQIYTLPESIAKLKKVKKIGLYGSNLLRVPPEIGEMESLEYFDAYCSYNLNWFPFEIMHCKKLVNSRISTRALLGSIRSGSGFPNLEDAPIGYFQGNVKCSVCRNHIEPDRNKQMWITLGVGNEGSYRDYLPLLANICSDNCEESLNKLPEPPPYYRPYPHQGGVNIPDPELTYREWIDKHAVKIRLKDIPKHENKNESKDEPPRTLKLVTKIWEK